MLEKYLALVQAASQISSDIAAIVHTVALWHAGATQKLTPDELTQLRAAWQEDVDRTAKNASL